MSSPLSRDEITDLREATPGVEHVVHLNHAGASLPSRSVLDTQINQLELEAATGGYEAAELRADDDAAVYASIASLIGAQPQEIARADHATAAWNAGFWSLPMRAGQRILTANAAYGSNGIAFLRAQQLRGVAIEVIPDDEHGQIDTAELERSIDNDVALVALTHAPTNGGLVNPAAEVGRIANEAGVPFLLDACQSVGQLAVDVSEIGCDLLSATGRKYLRGPRGSGFLYASDRIIDRLEPDHPDNQGADWTTPSTFTLADGARRFEHWEYNHAAWLGLGTAVDEALALGLDRIEATVCAVAESLREQLRTQGFQVWDTGLKKCGLVTATVEGVSAFAVKDALRARAINVSTSTPASTRFDSTRRNLPDLIRLSVHYLTTDDELAKTVAAMQSLRKQAQG